MKLPRRGFWGAALALASLPLAGRAADAAPGGAAAQAPDADLAACRDLALRASMRMDANDADGLVALFTPDLEFVRPATWPEVVIHGRAQLKAAIVARPTGFVSRHIFSNSVADRVGPDEVRVVSYFTHFSGTRTQGAAPIPMDHALRSLGEYEDRLVRTPDGWRIARRVAHFIFGGL